MMPALPVLAALQALPLSVKLPAAASTLAYINAKFGISYDVGLLGALFRTTFTRDRREKEKRMNHFYYLEEHALDPRSANRPFLFYQNQEWTFHEVYQIALRYGAWFKQKHGIGRGDVVAMDFMNSASFIFIWMGLWSIGAVPAFINYNLTKNPLTHCVKVSTTRLLLVESDLRDSFPKETLDVLSAPDFREDGGSVEVLFYDAALEAEMMKAPPVRAPDADREDDDGTNIGTLIYTSGTTGLPKPAIVSWNKCLLGGRFVSLFMGLRQDDRVYTCMPLYHSTAAVLGYVGCMMNGTSIAIGRKFSASKFWDEVRESNSTVVQYVGETMRYLLATPSRFDSETGENLDQKHNVRMAYGNGLRPDVWQRVKDRFNIPTIAELYAATEGTAGSWNLSSNDFSAGAIGRNGLLSTLLVGRSIAIVEFDHVAEAPYRDPKSGMCKEVTPGDPGELLFGVDPENIKEKFQGYFNNKKASDGKIMRDVLKKGDAWFRTGDVIRWDSEGRWYFSDRIGDTFRWRSENVSTNEVAEVMGSHQDLHETNVYGVKLPNHEGRAGCAAVVTRDQATLSDPESKPVLEPSAASLRSIASHVSDSLPKYAVPLFLRVMRQMQATGNNKQQKHVLRTEGVDPEAIKSSKTGDILYWFRDGTYKPFGEEEWSKINAGQVKL